MVGQRGLMVGCCGGVDVVSGVVGGGGVRVSGLEMGKGEGR